MMVQDISLFHQSKTAAMLEHKALLKHQKDK